MLIEQVVAAGNEGWQEYEADALLSRLRAARRLDALSSVTVVHLPSAAARRARTTLLILLSMATGAVLMHFWTGLQRDGRMGDSAAEQAARPLFTSVASKFTASPVEAMPPAAAAPASFKAETADPRAEAIALLDEWAAAWAQRDVGRYLALYSSRFVPADRLSRPAWEAQRRARILGKQRIFVGIDDLSIEMLEGNRILARFAQTYETDRYRESRVSKMLILVREGGAWRIDSEFNPRERSAPKRILASAESTSPL